MTELPAAPPLGKPRRRGGNLIGKAAFAQIEFARDSPLEGTGFEPSVRLLRKALLSLPRRRHERRSHLQVEVRNGNACLEWLPIAFPFAEGPRVRIRLPPPASRQWNRRQSQ
jgi:hypothetical protein